MSPPSPRDETAPHVGWRRRLLRATAWTFGLVTVLTVALVVVVQTDWGRDQLRKYLVSLVNQSIAGELQLDRLEGNPLGQPVLRGVVLRDPSGQTVVQVEQVAVDMDLLGLLSRRVDIRTLKIGGIGLAFQGQGGAVGLLAALAPADPSEDSEVREDSAPWSVSIGQLSLDESRFVFDPLTQDAEPAAIEQLWLSGSFSHSEGALIWNGFEAKGLVEGLPGKRGTEGFSVESSGSYGEGQLSLSSFSAAIGPHECSVTGVVRGLDGPSPAVALQIGEVGVSLGHLRERFSIPVRQGRSYLSGTVVGSLRSAEVDIEFESPMGVVGIAGDAGWQNGAPVLELELTGRRLSPLNVSPWFATPLTTDLKANIRSQGNPSTTGSLIGEVRLGAIGGVPGLPSSLEASLAIRKGDLSGTLRQAPVMDLRISGPWGSPYAFTLQAREVDVGAYASAAYITGLDADVRRLDGTGEIQWMPDSVGVLFRGQTVVENVALVAGRKQVDVAAVLGTIDVHYPGWGVPLGNLDVAIHEGQISDRGGATQTRRFVKRLNVDLETTPWDDERFSVGGSIAAYDIDMSDGSLAEVVVPLNIRVKRGDWRPQGKVNLRTRRAELGGIKAEWGTAALDFVPATKNAHILRTKGTLQVRRFASGEAIAMGRSGGSLSGMYDSRGRWSLDARLESSDVVSGGQRIRSMSSSLGLSGRTLPGEDLALSLQGRLKGRGWAVGSHARIGEADLQIDRLAFGDQPPNGRVFFELDGISARSPMGRLEGEASLSTDGRLTVSATGRGGNMSRDLELSVALPRTTGGETTVTIDRLEVQNRSGDGLRIADSQVSVGNRIIGISRLRIDETGRGRGSLEVRGRASTAGGGIAMTLSAKSLDMGRWRRHVESALGIRLALPSELAGRMDLELGVNRRKGVVTGQIAMRAEGGRYGEFSSMGGELRATLTPKLLSVDGQLTEGQLDGPISVQALKLPLGVRSPSSLRWGDWRVASGTIELPQIALKRFQGVLPPEWFAMNEEHWLGGSVRLEPANHGAAGPTLVATALSREIRPGKGGRRMTRAVIVARPDRTKVSVVRGPSFDRRRIDINLGVNYGILSPLLQRLGESPKPGEWNAFARKQLGQLLAANLTGTLRLNRFAPAQLPFVSEGLSQLRLEAFGPRDPGHDNAIAPLRIMGTVGAPVARGWLVADRIPMGDSSAYVQIGFDGVAGDERAEIQAAVNGQTIGTARLGLPRLQLKDLDGFDLNRVLAHPDLDLEVLTDAVSLDALTAISPPLGATLRSVVPEARASLHARLRGSPGGPNLRVEAQLTRREKAYVPSLLRTLRLSLDADPTQSHVRVMAGQGPDGGLALIRARADVGTNTLTTDREQTLRAWRQIPVTGAIDSRDFRLDRLEHLYPELVSQSKGWLEARIALSGTLGDPVLDGDSQLRFDDLELAGIGRRTDEAFDVGLRFEDRRMRLCRSDRQQDRSTSRLRGPCRPLEFVEGEGRASVSFEMQIPSLDPARMGLDARISMKDFDLFRSDALKLNTTAELSLTGTVASPLAAGEVTVNAAKFVPDVGQEALQRLGLPEDVQWVVGSGRQSRELNLGDVAGLAPLEFSGRFPIGVDIGLTLPRSKVVVVNPFIDARPWGELRAKRDDDGVLRVRGKVWVNDGVFRPYDREFTFLEDSYIDFTGDPSADPVLHIRAAYSIADVDLNAIGKTATPRSRITVAINGKAGAIDGEPGLVSDPPMSKEQIMSTIVMGTPALASGGADASALSEAALAFLGFSQALRKGFFFLDRFAFVPSNESVKLHVGKELAPEVWGYYDFNLNAREDESQHLIRVEWRFADRWRLETRLGDFQQGSLEMLYRYQY